jgi:hypothetical protein
MDCKGAVGAGKGKPLGSMPGLRLASLAGTDQPS